MKYRESFMVDEQPSNVMDLKTWTPKQVALAGAWAKHEIQHRTDKLCEPYPWTPAWTGLLNADTIYDLVQNHYSIK